MSFTESLADIIAENRNHLLGKHPSWERVPLNEVATILNGFPFPSDGFSNNGSGTPLIRIRDILRNATETFFRGEFDRTFLVHRGDLLIGMDGDFNSSTWMGESGLLNQRCCKVTPDIRYFDKRLLAYCLPGYLAAINAHTSSITVKHLSSRTVADIPLPLPPFAEQGRIADALDELLSDLEAAVEGLRRAQAKLTLYRVSVLKAAMEGMLTAEWRAQHPHTESGSELLKRILVDRRRRWEEAQLQKFKEKGREPPRNWQAAYKEPLTAEPIEVPLPERWCWVTLSQLLEGIEAGKSFTCEPRRAQEDEWGVIKVSAMTWGSFDESENKAVPKGKSYDPYYEIRPDDLLLSRANTVELVGATVLVERCRSKLLLSDKSMRLRYSLSLDRRWLRFALASLQVRQQMSRMATGTSDSMRNISQDNVARVRLGFPPLAEQEAIVEAVEDQLSIMDHVEATIDNRLTSAQALRQAILQQAFAGQLVPQDGNDAPASELLQRIAAQREERAREAGAMKHAIKRSAKPRQGKRARPATSTGDRSR
jgi:type I restriction enzyme S subunit